MCRWYRSRLWWRGWRVFLQWRGAFAGRTDVGADDATPPLLIRAARKVWRAAHRPQPSGRWDAIIVAGARVRDDGTASPALVRRVARGVELWREGLAPLLVMSGKGSGPRPEAPLMAEIARKQGVPQQALRVEAASMTTLENARFCAAEFGFGRIIVVSSPSHVHRCEQIFGQSFVSAVGVPARGPISKRLFVRETLLATWWG